jgi:hypothetical protein
MEGTMIGRKWQDPGRQATLDGIKKAGWVLRVVCLWTAMSVTPVFATPPSLPTPPVDVSLDCPQREALPGDTLQITLHVKATGPVEHRTSLPDAIHLALGSGLGCLTGDTVINTRIEADFDREFHYAVLVLETGDYSINGYARCDRIDSAGYPFIPRDKAVFGASKGAYLRISVTQAVDGPGEGAHDPDTGAGVRVKVISADELGISIRPTSVVTDTAGRKTDDPKPPFR